MFQTETRVSFLQVDNSFSLSRPFFGKWNWFVQMVNAIPGRNLPVLNLDQLRFLVNRRPTPPLSQNQHLLLIKGKVVTWGRVGGELHRNVK